MMKVWTAIINILIYITSVSMLFSQDPDPRVHFQNSPRNLQLYARDDSDSALVKFKGIVNERGVESIEVIIYKNENVWRTYSSDLTYTGDSAAFDIDTKIHAELSEYHFVVNLVVQASRSSVFSADSVVCGDVFIINGQSNAHYTWEDADFQNEFCRTFGVKTGSSNYFPYQPEDTLWNLAQGSSSLGPGVGTLGIYIQKFILEEYSIPTCIINGGTGGSIISEHQPDVADRMDLNTIYGKVLYRVSKANIKRIRGIVWHQGENDSDRNNTPLYQEQFRQLYNAWSSDFDPEKIYLFQIRPGCGGDTQSKFRDIQRLLPVSLDLDNVTLMSTAGLPGHDGCHYSHEGYINMAEWIYNLIRVDFYGSEDTLNIQAPNIENAIYHPANSEIELIFSGTESMIWPVDSAGNQMIDYFYLDGDFGMIAEGNAQQNSIVLKLNGTNFIDHITYLPDVKYHSGLATYQGPWLYNSRGIGALSFYNVSVQNPDTTVKVIYPNGGEIWLPQSEQTIEWTTKNVSIIDIDFSSDNGQTWNTIVEDIDTAPGSYTWTTPDLISPECKIRISDATNSITADESNLVFGIFAKSLTLLAPNGREKWLVDSTYTVSWNSEYIENVRIQYTTDNEGTWGTVKRIVSALDGAVEWQVPDKVSDQCKIRILDIDDANISDISDDVFSIVSPTDVTHENYSVPVTYSLKQNRPNPFNPSTIIEYQIAKEGFIKIDIMNTLGEKVRTLLRGNRTAGKYEIVWDGRNDAGVTVASGVYYYILYGDQIKIIKKMTLIR